MGDSSLQPGPCSPPRFSQRTAPCPAGQRRPGPGALGTTVALGANTCFILFSPSHLSHRAPACMKQRTKPGTPEHQGPPDQLWVHNIGGGATRDIFRSSPGTVIGSQHSESWLIVQFAIFKMDNQQGPAYSTGNSPRC